MTLLARALLLLALLAGAAGVRAQDLLPVPPLTARVIDLTATLDAAQVQALERKLAAFEAESGPQIVVLMLASTQPEDIAAYAQRIGDAWKIGRREVGDGLLIVVAMDDRRINIQVAKALEGAVPDLAARQVIDRAIKPAFRAGDHAAGLDAALEMLFARIRGEALPAPQLGDAHARQDGSLDWQALAMFFFIGVPVVASVLTRMLGRKLGALASAGAAGTAAWWVTTSIGLALLAGVGALLLVGLFGIGAAARSVLRSGGAGHRGPPIIWGGGGSHDDWGGGGSWGGGGFGGGFSSGGGGDFGGGGASGDW